MQIREKHIEYREYKYQYVSDLCKPTEQFKLKMEENVILAQRFKK